MKTKYTPKPEAGNGKVDKSLLYDGVHWKRYISRKLKEGLFRDGDITCDPEFHKFLEYHKPKLRQEARDYLRSLGYGPVPKQRIYSITDERRNQQRNPESSIDEFTTEGHTKEESEPDIATAVDLLINQTDTPLQKEEHRATAHERIAELLIERAEKEKWSPRKIKELRERLIRESTK